MSICHVSVGKSKYTRARYKLSSSGIAKSTATEPLADPPVTNIFLDEIYSLPQNHEILTRI